MTEAEMVGWHHRLSGHEFGWTPGVGDGQGSLACCSPWGRKELDTTDDGTITKAPERRLSSCGAVALSCSAACGIFPEQGSNPFLLHWEANSSPLSYQGSPHFLLLIVFRDRSEVHLLNDCPISTPSDRCGI